MTHFLCCIDLSACLKLIVKLGHLEPLLGQCTLHRYDVYMIFESFGGCWNLEGHLHPFDATYTPLWRMFHFFWTSFHYFEGCWASWWCGAWSHITWRGCGTLIIERSPFMMIRRLWWGVARLGDMIWHLKMKYSTSMRECFTFWAPTYYKVNHPLFEVIYVTCEIKHAFMMGVLSYEHNYFIVEASLGSWDLSNLVSLVFYVLLPYLYGL